MILFLYGTLRPYFGHALGLELGRSGVYRGVASVQGALFDCGEFPAAVSDPTSRYWIKGELYELPREHRLWAELDEYEDYKPQNLSESLFARAEIVAFDEDANPLKAEIYLYRASTSGLARIEGGDYLSFCRR